MNYTILVNKNNKIKANYLNKVKLITTKDQDNKDVEVEEETFKAFKALQAYLLTENIHIAIDSSYRSIADQEKIYNDFLSGEVYSFSIDGLYMGEELVNSLYCRLDSCAINNKCNEITESLYFMQRLKQDTSVVYDYDEKQEATINTFN